MDLAASIILAGVGNAALLAGLSAFNARKHPAAAWLCALLALLSLAAAAILVQHRADGLVERLAVTLEHVAAYAAPPIVYLFVRAALGTTAQRARTWIHFLPAALYAAIGAPLTLSGLAEPPPFELTIGYMMAYTAASLILFAKSWARDGFSTKFAWPAAILATMSAIHAGQLVRMTSDSPAIQDIVAMIGAIAVFGLILLALAGIVPWAAAAANRYTKSTASRENLQAAFETLKLKLEEEGRYRRPDLRLADVAGAAGMTPHQASQALSQAGGVTFNELLAGLRVEEARQLLTRPENASVAVEPIGMMAGFRSRSSFYQAFQKRLGQTPAEYRRRFLSQQSCPVQSGRTGKG